MKSLIETKSEVRRIVEIRPPIMSEYGAQARGRDIPDHHNLGLSDKRTRFPTRKILDYISKI